MRSEEKGDLLETKKGSSGEEPFFVFFRFKMAGVTGLEPAAFAVTGRRCNQLNYTPKTDLFLMKRE